MANRKIDKALYGPSTLEVALGALLGLAFGVLAACIYLVFKPVHVVKELPKETAIGAVYFIPGHSDGVKGRNWAEKQKRFLESTTVILTEDELNLWAASFSKPAPTTPAPAPAPAAPKPGAKPTPPPAPAKPDAKSAEPAAPAATEAFFTVNSLDFRLVGSELQVGYKCTFSAFGLVYEVPANVVGGFGRRDNHVVFEPHQAYLGSCPLHRLPGLAAVLNRRILAALKLPEKLTSAWEKVSDVSVENSLLKISMAP